ncbi:phage/plasmid primase, P4 family [Amycolatopsis cynarae]|uniref:Phage/plasmid primase, P4 family n=1 Tax=Amycolatopsis cynarae TaxID=2995223 RepID=A0ABY7AWY3_9PSEU|nr:phage/plasmid primase, P4 family [Amycolatopsis sp. HUAS 11-8]WAL64461.1 phage/plasmid primase, P4 family [Amycolatopsis sp. HUAS 11-8]
MSENKGEVFPSPQQPLTVARRLIDAWQEDGVLTLRHWRGQWMRWQGTHWAEVEDLAVRAVLYRRLENALFVIEKDGESTKRPWSPTKRKIADVLDAMGAVMLLPNTVDAPEWIDRRKAPAGDSTLVACLNGLLQVAERKLLDLTPAFFNLVSVPFDYDPAAPRPERWLRFLDELWPDDQAAVEALQEFFGYVVSGRTDLHKILLIVGPTRSGKGTIARVLSELVGKGNMAGPTLASLASNFGLQPLLGKPLAIISDARLGGRDTQQVVERLLTISGEDTIDIDLKYRQPWTGRLPTRIVILSNELPNFGDASGAIAHRFIVLPMQVSWLGKEDPGLTQKLTAEMPGILNWALDGLERLSAQGRFTEPESSKDAVLTMQDNASPTSAFVRERCEVGAGHEVTVDELYQEWKDWCEDSGRERPGNKQAFGRNLGAVVPQVRRARPRGDGGKQVPTYRGIRLKRGTGDEGKTHNGNVATQCDSRDSGQRGDPAVSGVSRDESRPNPLWSSHSEETGDTATVATHDRDHSEPPNGCNSCARPMSLTQAADGAWLCQDCARDHDTTVVPIAQRPPYPCEECGGVVFSPVGGRLHTACEKKRKAAS